MQAYAHLRKNGTIKTMLVEIIAVIAAIPKLLSTNIVSQNELISGLSPVQSTETPIPIIKQITTEVKGSVTNTENTATPSSASTPSPLVMSFNTQNPTTPQPTAITNSENTGDNTPKPTAKPTIKPTIKPSDSPKPTKYQITGPELDALFTKYSEKYKISREQLKKIAVCESYLNTNALNVKYGYAGMYQFSENSWKAYRKLLGEDQAPNLRFSPEESVKTAAWMLSTGRQDAWPNCK